MFYVACCVCHNEQCYAISVLEILIKSFRTWNSDSLLSALWWGAACESTFDDKGGVLGTGDQAEPWILDVAI
ncbi:hypothetical protein C4D60_Mb06t05200 [Musa balbisiana]|uniref:Uncharacterized protein n=1 Tax=Musa balbisiana TaxID=52838 RepID=A0A4S8IN72_MUSBA|nr:hypothetical protein C4D60_Mb06t05200 [Musa balbisiana]